MESANFPRAELGASSRATRRTVNGIVWKWATPPNGGAGLEHARRKGAAIDRPRVDVDVAQLKELRQRGLSWAEIRKQSSVCRSTAQPALAGHKERPLSPGPVPLQGLPQIQSSY